MKRFSSFAMVVLAIATAVLATLPVESLRITAAAATAICSLIAFIGAAKSAKENSRLKQRVSALEEDRENAATTREREARDETERLKKLSGELQAKLCDIREKTDAARKEHSSLLSSNSDIAATLEDEKQMEAW